MGRRSQQQQIRHHLLQQSLNNNSLPHPTLKTIIQRHENNSYQRCSLTQRYFTTNHLLLHNKSSQETRSSQLHLHPCPKRRTSEHIMILQTHSIIPFSSFRYHFSVIRRIIVSSDSPFPSLSSLQLLSYSPKETIPSQIPIFPHLRSHSEY